MLNLQGLFICLALLFAIGSVLAGIRVVAEWVYFAPRNGQFDFRWFAPLVGSLVACGIFAGLACVCELDYWLLKRRLRKSGVLEPAGQAPPISPAARDKWATANREIGMRMLALLEAFEGQLPAEQLAEMRELAEANESGIALENLCSQLHEFDVIVTPEHGREIADLGKAMEMPEGVWLKCIQKVQ